MSKLIHFLSNIDPTNRTAKCSNCGDVKIGKSRTDKNGKIYYRCSVALNKNSRESKYKRKYNINASEVDNKNCEICGGNIRMAYDHCHKSGKFRGWLCMKCNTALGLVNDDPKILKKMITYLKNI